eukprot:g2238.t1
MPKANEIYKSGKVPTTDELYDSIVTGDGKSSIVLDEASVTDLTPFRNPDGANKSFNIVNHISLKNNNELVDISPLSPELYHNPQWGLTGLRHLDLTGCKSLKDISCFKTFKTLRTFSVEGCAVEDLSSIAELVELEKINASGCLIVDVSALASLVNLVQLDLSNNKIADISSLKSVAEGQKENPNFKLKEIEINLHGNQIEDPSPLSAFGKTLKKLTLTENPIQDGKSLNGLSAAVKTSLIEQGVKGVENSFACIACIIA